MTFFKNTVSLLAVFCVIPAAFGATARISAMPVATSGRMPTVIKSTGGTTTPTSSTSSLMDNAECIDAYTECIKGEDVCGSELEECTTNVAFHGKMPLCFSTLYQCKSDGIKTLFGTSAIDALSNVSTKNAAGEVTRYTYPTDGSVLGQLIIGSSISNRYPDSATCVKKYKSCMFRDTTCGEEFELCTDSSSFKKLAPNCDNILALCPSSGIKELFGTDDKTTRPSTGYGSGAVAEWVSDGADLAAANAVNTCYKTADTCFLNACAKNPYRCIEGTDLSVVESADIIGSGDQTTIISSDVGKQDAATIKKFFKSACIDTVGTNKYCYMTFNDGKSPKKTDLTDPYNQEDLFSEAYSARKTYLNSKLQTLVENFDSKAKKACTDTIKSCVMRSCGGGSGAVCYSKVFGNGGDGSINKGEVYEEIKNGCSAIVNTDPNCRYAAAVSGADATYSYMYNDNGAFGTLFGAGDDTTFVDPIGAVAALDSLLTTSYNDAAIAQLQTQCENVAKNCVKSMCGADYVNCYRSRTDIKGTTYDSGTAAFQDSMNKLGGVLDYNVILGLCQNTVKNSDACTEHLSIAKAKINENVRDNLWGNTVGESWLGTTATYTSSPSDVQATDANGSLLCQCSDGGSAVCESEENGVIGCSQPLMTDVNTAVSDQASASLIQNLLAGIEKEAQGLYQSKLIKQRNMCEAGNNGGIVGANDMAASTYMWVKLAGTGKVPSDYSTQGLSAKQFAQTNDLYGGFCRLRVDIKSDDVKVNEKLKDMSSRFFAVGDAFTCGSWISQAKLNEITNAVASDAVNSATLKSQERTRGWLTAVSALGGAVGGGILTNNLLGKEDSGLGGLLGTAKNSEQTTKYNYAEQCLEDYKAYQAVSSGTDYKAMKQRANDMIDSADKAGVSILPEYREAARAVTDKYTDSTLRECTNADWKEFLDAKATELKNKPSSLCSEGFNKVKVSIDVNGHSIDFICSKEGDDDSYGETKALAGDCSSSDGCTAVTNNVNTSELADFGSSAIRYTWNNCGSNGKEITESATDKQNAAVKTLNDKMYELKDACQNILDEADDNKAQEAEKEQKKKLAIATGVGSAVGGAALGVTTYFATRDIQNAQNDKAKQDAIKEWMDNIGSKIKCYIGADEVGSYGDVVSTTLE